VLSTPEIAAELIAAYDARSLIAPFSARGEAFGSETAYEVLHHIERERDVRGWRPVGRKIGFTNRTIWELYGVPGPMWARMWDRTVTFVADEAAPIAVDQFVQPRLEPEVVFKLAAPVSAGDDPEQILAGIEWIAAGFEIVQCHYPEWRFDLAECTASFGLHGALVVGPPTSIRDLERSGLAETLATFTATLSRDGSVVEQGSGANVLGSPAAALEHLAQRLAAQSLFEGLAAGEIITTGTLTDAQPVAAGERWSCDYGALGLQGIDALFV
jgi:2-oxo-3-hexenedioate decarboxylase